LDEQFRPAFVERTVVAALAAALTAPTLVCIDDAQFADDASRGVLRAVAAEAPDRPWLLLVARRSSSDDGEPLLGEAVHLDLGPLAEDEARLMLASDTHDAPMSEHLTAEVLGRGDGNPMFLRELVKAVHDGHLPDVLPDSVEDVVAMQIGQLAPLDRDMLRAASVVGMTVEPDVLAEVLGSSYDDVSEQLTALQTFLTGDGTAVRFRQAVTRDAAYAGLPFRLRAEFHGRVADAFVRRGLRDGADESTLSLHLFEANRFADAATTARSAATRAATAYANVEAETLYGRAIAATRKSDDPDARAMAEMLEELADVRVRLGEYQQADVAYAGACRQRRDDAVALARIVLKTGWNASWHGKFALAIRRSRRAQSLLADVGEPDAARLRMDITVLAANTHFRQGRLAEARGSLLSLLEHADEQQAPDVVAEALGLLDLAEMGLGLPVDGSRADQALRLYEALGDLHDEARLLNQIGSGRYFAGHWQDALDFYRRARDLLVRTGDAPNAAVTEANIAEILVDQGHPEEAEASLRAALRTWRAARALNDVAFANALLGRVLARQGNYEQAHAVLAEARAYFASQGARTEVVDADAYRAELLLLEGRPAEALPLAREALASAALVSERPAQAPLLHRIAAAALDAMGERSAAMAAYSDALSIARQRDAAHDVAFTLTAMATQVRTAGGQPDPAWLEEAATLGRSLGLVIDVTGRAPVNVRDVGQPTPT
jgi:tetratricopeptide (TPR) repeat protein